MSYMRRDRGELLAGRRRSTASTVACMLFVCRMRSQQQRLRTGPGVFLSCCRTQRMSDTAVYGATDYGTVHEHVHVHVHVHVWDASRDIYKDPALYMYMILLDC